MQLMMNMMTVFAIIGIMIIIIRNIKTLQSSDVRIIKEMKVGSAPPPTRPRMDGKWEVKDLTQPLDIH